MLRFYSRSRAVVTARKTPRQARSRDMVEALLAAAARVFVREGYARATTNRIAAAAGVSVGSLYQYFPSKDALAVELLRRYRERLLDLVEHGLAPVAAGQTSLEDAVRSLVASLLRAEGIDPALHRALIEQVARTRARSRELAGFEERLEEVVATALRGAGRGDVRVRDVPLASFVVVRVALALVQAAVADRPDVDRAALVDEITRLIVGYLRV